MIKLQREVKDKGSKLLSMETKFKNLSEVEKRYILGEQLGKEN